MVVVAVGVVGDEEVAVVTEQSRRVQRERKVIRRSLEMERANLAEGQSWAVC